MAEYKTPGGIIVDINDVEGRTVKLGVPFRTFEARVNLTGRVEGEFEDWPNNLKDEVAAALERLALRAKPKYPLRVIKATCELDEDGHYAVIVAQEYPPDLRGFS